MISSALKTETAPRCKSLSLERYQLRQGYPRQREQFHNAWFTQARKIAHRLRTARTNKLLTSMIDHTFGPRRLPATFQQMLNCRQGWKDLRDILTLILAARSLIQQPEGINP